MTYSIIGRCARTGQLGLGVTTFSLAVGGRCEGVSPFGVSKTQAFPNRTNDPLATRLLAEGYTPARIMAILAANDPDHDYRQIAIMDREGRTCGHTGDGTRKWSGHLEGKDCISFGNVLAGPQVVEGIVAGFLARPDDPLEFRLMAALEGGRDAGGQGTVGNRKAERSAVIKVFDRLDYPEVDVRVDVHPTAVAELRRVLEEFTRYRTFYRERGRNPREAIPQDTFVKTLSQPQPSPAR